MIEMASILVIAMLSLAPIETGYASWYAPGVMERVVATRQRWGQLPGDVTRYDGFVAVRECGDIGTELWIKPARGERYELFLAADCAAPPAYQWMVRGGILVEVDADTRERWGLRHGLDNKRIVIAKSIEDMP